MLALLHRLAPEAVIEKASIDEVYLDVTSMVEKEVQVGEHVQRGTVAGQAGRQAVQQLAVSGPAGMGLFGRAELVCSAAGMAWPGPLPCQLPTCT